MGSHNLVTEGARALLLELLNLNLEYHLGSLLSLVCASPIWVASSSRLLDGWPQVGPVSPPYRRLDLSQPGP